VARHATAAAAIRKLKSLRKKTDSDRGRARDGMCHQLMLIRVDIVAVSFDYLVGDRQQGRRNADAERLGGLQVDDELEFIRPNNW
jgi:hypothetical protein